MRKTIALLAVLMTIAAAAAALSGCGAGSGITREDHARISMDMTMDDVEAILGQPERSHVTGSTQEPSIFWYYTKAEGDGLVKISFEGGKVTNIAPYDQSFEVGE